MGSSSKSTLGAHSSSAAMFTRLSSPPEIPRLIVVPMVVPRVCSRPMSFATSATRSSTSALEASGMRKRAVNNSVSRTVSCSMKMSLWRTYPRSAAMCCRRDERRVLRKSGSPARVT